MDRGRNRLGDMNRRGLRLGDLGRRRDALFDHGRRCGGLLLDEEWWLRHRLLVARFVRSGLLSALLLRPLFRAFLALFRFAIAIPLTMTIAAAAPLLFPFLGRLLARVGQPALRALLLRLLRLLRSRRSLLLVAFAAGA
jgi:hypothetical protein